MLWLRSGNLNESSSQRRGLDVEFAGACPTNPHNFPCLFFLLKCGHRKRRIKCDEQKPSCYHCIRSGWRCDGYSHMQPEITKSQQQDTLVSSPQTSSPVSSISVHLEGTTRQRRSFNFFLEFTAPHLCAPEALTDEFWKTLLLQTAHHEPVVKHAVIALGALHETFEKGEFDSGDKDFAVSQYIRSLELMVKPESKKRNEISVDVALITCVLFVCFEVRISPSNCGISSFVRPRKMNSTHSLTDSPRPTRFCTISYRWRSEDSKRASRWGVPVQLEQQKHLDGIIHTICPCVDSPSDIFSPGHASQPNHI